MTTVDEVAGTSGEGSSRLAAWERLNEDLRRLLASTGIGILFIDRSLNLHPFNPDRQPFGDLQRPEAERPSQDVPHSLCRDCLEEEARIVLGTGRPREQELRTKSGQWYLVQMRPYGPRDGPEGVVATFIDVTMRKQMEEALRQERNAAQLYLDVAGVMFVVLDMDGRVMRVNHMVSRILGYTEEELLGQHWFGPFLPPRVRANVRSTFDRMMSGDLPPVRNYEHPVLTRDGAERLVVWHTSLIRNDEGTVVAAVGSGTDVTEQRRLERQVIHISEMEQRRIGSELHDGLGSHLSGLAMLSRGLARNLRDGRTLRAEDLDELASLASEGVNQARALARGLNPVKLDTQGLPSALHELAATTETVSGIRCSFTQQSDLPEVPGEVAVQLYRIAQEALNNAVKHAQASRIEITLNNDDGFLWLLVRDDGVGLPAADERQNGMGLRILPYRSHLIGATLSINSSASKGTEVCCCLPDEPYVQPRSPADYELR